VLEDFWKMMYFFALRNECCYISTFSIAFFFVAFEQSRYASVQDDRVLFPFG